MTSSPATAPRSSVCTVWSSPTRRAGPAGWTTAGCGDGTVQLDSVEVRTPDGRQLVNPLDLHLNPGDTLVITGQSGSGKTTLLRSLARLWPFTVGTMTLPRRANATMFLSQMPYVPLGDLRAVVSYPCEEGTITDEELNRVLIEWPCRT